MLSPWKIWTKDAEQLWAATWGADINRPTNGYTKWNMLAPRLHYSWEDRKICELSRATLKLSEPQLRDLCPQDLLCHANMTWILLADTCRLPHQTRPLQFSCSCSHCPPLTDPAPIPSHAISLHFSLPCFTLCLLLWLPQILIYSVSSHPHPNRNPSSSTILSGEFAYSFSGVSPSCIDFKIGLVSARLRPTILLGKQFRIRLKCLW